MKIAFVSIVCFGFFVGCGAASSSNGASSSGSTSSGSSSGGSSSGDTSSGTTSSGSTSSGGTSSGGTSSGNASDAGADTGGAAKKGLISVGQSSTVAAGKTYYSSYGMAYFYEYDPSISSACTFSTSDPCAVTLCDLSGGATDAGVVTPPNAGTIEIAGGMLASNMVLTPTNGNGTYTVPVLQEQVFAPGQTLTVSGSGGDVPAFSGHTVGTPEEIHVSAPVFDAQNHAIFARSGDLAIAWSGASSGNVQVQVATSEMNVRSVTISCTFPASSGSGIVPASAMGQLQQANGSNVFGSIAISPQASAPFHVDDWDVTFVATATSKTGIFTAAD